MLEISPQNASYLSVPLRHSCSVTRRRLRGRITTPESTKKTLSAWIPETWIPETHNYGISLTVKPPVTRAKA